MFLDPERDRRFTARLGRPARVGVVGAREWADDLAAVAPAWRREVVAVIDPAGVGRASLDLADVDELVVSGTAFRTVVANVPYTARAGIATIVQDGLPDDVFAPALSRTARAVKRVLDIGLGSVALVLTAPVIAAAAIAVRFESAGPALFRQHRAGLNGRSFCLLKLRTMRVDNDDRAHRAYVASLIDGNGQRRGGLFKLTDDPRVTRVGRFLRHYSIDELPQLINVVRGEMSLVGPRPPVAAEVEHYGAEQWLRLRVKPGMTGAWQVGGRNALTYAEMVALDIDYWRRWSLRSELRILLQTIPTVVRAKGAA